MAVSSFTPINKGEALTVPITSVWENAWNYNVQDDVMFSKQKNSLQKFDLVQPIVVREINHGYEIINGAHRFRAAQELGMTDIAIWNLGVVDDTQAQQLTIMLNELKGRPDVDNLASLIKGLDDVLGREEIVMNLPFPEQAIEDMINTLEFDWSAFEAEDEETSNPTSNDMIRMEFRLTAEQAQSVNEAINDVIMVESISNDDAGRALAITRICLEYLIESEDVR